MNKKGGKKKQEEEICRDINRIKIELFSWRSQN